jgi:putative transposase
VVFSVELPTPPCREGERVVGIDLGIATFAAFSDGAVIPSLKAARRAERDLRIAQRARLVRDYDLIAIEALHVKALASSSLAKDVNDASWSKFISFLRYKAVKAGTRLIEVDPRNTSQDCSGCGARIPKELRDRRHECPDCGLSIERDLNAARKQTASRQEDLV